jgi:hypothetical protein
LTANNISSKVKLMVVPDPNKSKIDRSRKSIKLAERKARELRVTVFEYLRGIAKGTYLPYTRAEVDAEPLD